MLEVMKEYGSLFAYEVTEEEKKKEGAGVGSTMSTLESEGVAHAAAPATTTAQESSTLCPRCSRGENGCKGNPKSTEDMKHASDLMELAKELAAEGHAGGQAEPARSSRRVKARRWPLRLGRSGKRQDGVRALQGAWGGDQGDLGGRSK